MQLTKTVYYALLTMVPMNSLYYYPTFTRYLKYTFGLYSLPVIRVGGLEDYEGHSLDSYH